MKQKKYSSGIMKLLPEWTWNYAKRKPIAAFNPARAAEVRYEQSAPVYSVFDYDGAGFDEKIFATVEDCLSFLHSGRLTWINMDGLKKQDIEKLCVHYGIHHLLAEDILSIGQRAKMDDMGNIIFCLLPMLYYNDDTGEVEAEQVSIVLGDRFVISFQEDPKRDVFNPVRDRIRNGHYRTRNSSADYLCYSLIDIIVDSYFNIIEKLNERIERLEDSLLLQKEKAALGKISILRREIMMMRRNISPVRELVAGFVRSESDLLEKEHEKYYKDVYDHITQANDYTENHRDMLMNMQDLSMSQINMRMNEVMKIFTLLATLMAPATVIGGIFGMNFDVIPLAHHAEGFYVTVFIMLAIPLIMWLYFKRKGWF